MSSPIEPDNLQQAWRSQSSQTRISIDPELLRSAVQRKQRSFRATVLFRDALEIGTAAVMLPYWFYGGIKYSLPWTWWLSVPAIIFVAGFLLIDRRRHSQKPTDPDQPLVKVVQDSLNQVDHQIWLLRNVFWWYLLPFIIPILAFFAHVTWSTSIPSEGWLSTLLSVCLFLFLAVFLLVLYGFVYWLNQNAVRTQLQPRRNELSQLLTSLTEETGRPLDETQIANLRPTALALAAAGQVKPVEFKVSFWQLAFFGEIGFIGFWFFSMLSLALTQWLRAVNVQVWTTKGPSFFQLLFSWPHLAWLVPFFLGGLLYAWILQRFTARAVGISTLGVHLQKGQILILWDEIKEIQIFKLMGIRSLWLIRESGEKTILPWTGLERHSDLRTAVERFAPANHPIRQHLSLLR